LQQIIGCNVCPASPSNRLDWDAVASTVTAKRKFKEERIISGYHVSVFLLVLDHFILTVPHTTEN